MVIIMRTNSNLNEHTISQTNYKNNNYHTTMAANEFITNDDLNSILSDDGSSWEVASSSTNIKVWRKKVPEDSLYHMKVVATLPYPRRLISQLLYDIDIRRSWDNLILDLHVVEKKDESNDVIYYAINARGPVTSRDFLQARQVKYDTAKQTQYIRAQTHYSGYILAPDKTNPQNTIVTLMSCNDVKGWVPSFFVNFMSSRAPPSWFKKFNKACETFVHNCYAFPEWLGTHVTVETNAEATEDENNKVE